MPAFLISAYIRTLPFLFIFSPPLLLFFSIVFKPFVLQNARLHHAFELVEETNHTYINIHNHPSPLTRNKTKLDDDNDDDGRFISFLHN